MVQERADCTFAGHLEALQADASTLHQENGAFRAEQLVDLSSEPVLGLLVRPGQGISMRKELFEDTMGEDAEKAVVFFDCRMDVGFSRAIRLSAKRAGALNNSLSAV